MAEAETIAAEMASRLLTRHCDPGLVVEAENGAFPASLWAEIEAAGLTLSLVPEQCGGPGLPMGEALAILRVAARHATPLPLAETMLALRLFAMAGLGLPEGPTTFAASGRQTDTDLSAEGAGWRLRGRADRVPWGRHAGTVVILIGEGKEARIALLRRGEFEVTPGQNAAFEPRDELTFDVRLPTERVAGSPIGVEDAIALGAVLRCQQLAGAIVQVLTLTATYVQERVQFGRPLGKLQAVQQNVAVLAGHAAAAVAAADLASDAMVAIDMRAIAAAKIRCGEAAGAAAGIAHQLHGAMGFTREYPLGLLTKRLWSWRDEFGNEARWSAVLGSHLARAGADRLWAELTDI